MAETMSKVLSIPESQDHVFIDQSGVEVFSPPPMTTLDDAAAYPQLLPLAPTHENEKSRKWFEESYFPRVCVQEYLQIASELREGQHACRFGERTSGSYNVVFFIIFDDGIEWVVKAPRGNLKADEEHIFLASEYATLRFLHEEIRTIPAPKIHGYCLDTNNPTKTPYIMMDKVPGIPLWRAFRGHDMGRDKVFQMLRDLAEVRKALAKRTWLETGSFDIVEGYVVVERQLSHRNFFDAREEIEHRPGAFESSIGYYVNLLQESWRKAQEGFTTSEEMLLQWRIHLYLASVLPSYVKPQDGGFFLAHTDLSPSNILLNPQTGSITGIIDWEFACTLPFQATEHFPLLLRKDFFADHFNDVYDDPEAEIEVWRAFYAEQFHGDEAMQDYLRNIDAAIAFEDILKDNELATVENLVENCKFLKSAETLEKIEIPFPWKTPTKERSPPPSTDTDWTNTSVNGNLEAAVKMEQTSDDDDHPTTDNASAISPSQSIHTGYDEHSHPAETMENVEMAVEPENSLPGEFRTTNGGDDETSMSPSPSTHTADDEHARAAETTEKMEMEVQPENSSHNELVTTNGGEQTIFPSHIPDTQHDEPPTPIVTPEKVDSPANSSSQISPATINVGIQPTFSLSRITRITDTVDTVERNDVMSCESRSLNSFVGTRQRRRVLTDGLVSGIKNLPRRVKSGGKMVWRVCACPFTRSSDESEKQDRRKM